MDGEMKQRRRARAAVEPWGAERAALDAARDAAKTPAGGWLRVVREWRGTRQKDLAAQLGTQRQAWAQLELSEQRDAISLYSLRKAARALGCDVVCYLVPVKGAPAAASASSSPAPDASPAVGSTEAPRAAAPAAEASPGWFEGELRTELL
jgi:transcriptional regulator with XRE-family HTH domain